MIKGCNAAPKLRRAIDDGKPIAYFTALKYSIICQKAEELRKTYLQEYKDKFLNDAGYFNDRYAIYREVLEDGTKVYMNDCYETVTTVEDLSKPIYERPLKKEIQELIEAGKAIPTKELYVKLKLEPAMETITPDNISTEDLITDGFEAFDEVVGVIADEIHTRVKQYLAGRPEVSQDQLARYNTKYELAKKVVNDDDETAKAALTLEASLLGIDVVEYANTIVAMGDQWNAGLELYEMRIEAFRVAVKNAYQQDPEAAVNILIEANQLDASATDEEIAAIFEKYLNTDEETEEG